MASKKAPDIFVYNPNQKDCYGAVRMITEMSEDIRFNSCSELTFKVAEKICDPLTGKYVTNPIYNQLEADNLLYICDDRKYFSFPNRKLRNDYGVLNSQLSSSNGRRESYQGMTFNYAPECLVGFEIQKEICLYNICAENGYSWECTANITTGDGYKKYTSTGSDLKTYYRYIACKDFIPISRYDVISIRNTDTNYSTVYPSGKNKFYLYTVFFYEKPDSNTCLGWTYIWSGLNEHGTARDNHNNVCGCPVIRFNLESFRYGVRPTIQLTNNVSTYDELLERFKNGGYIRIDAIGTYKNPDQSPPYNSYDFFYNLYGGVEYFHWTVPPKNWIKIYSGEKYCTKIYNDESIDGNYELPLHWFVITDTQEDTNGISKIKTVTAYSYEYTLSNRTISLSEDTLPFYIPEQIQTATQDSAAWYIDYGYYQSSQSSYLGITGKQHITPGIFNQILDLLPDWSVGHISSELMTRYRKVNDVDNLNLYSFLMNDVEQLYHCYFVFDNDNKTISAYTQEDIINNSNIDNANIILNWQNTIQSLTIKDMDINTITALRVHTAEEQYGVGLVNPSGNSVLYNFNGILDKLDFVADTDTDRAGRNVITENGKTRFRTLKEAVIKLMEYLNNPNITFSYNMSSSTTVSDLSQFRNHATNFVKANIAKIKAESSMYNCKSEYESVINKIGVQGEYRNSGAYFNSGDSVRTESYLSNLLDNNGYSYFINVDNYNNLVSAAKNYYSAKDEYNTQSANYRKYYNILRNVAAKASLNYKTQSLLTYRYNAVNSYVDGQDFILSILTPNEILALQPFIREGDWTNDNITFRDGYDESDIIDTLVDAYNQAKGDLDLFLSNPQYDFEVETTNISKADKMASVYKNIRLGQTLHINTNNNNYITPVLLEIHINYNDDNDFKMTFTTNYKRKPTQFRFADLYGAVSQTSVTDNTFTFDD